MPDAKPTVSDVDAAFREKILGVVNDLETQHSLTPLRLLMLAEAWAWVQTPHQPHSGASKPESA